MLGWWAPPWVGQRVLHLSSSFAMKCSVIPLMLNSRRPPRSIPIYCHRSTMLTTINSVRWIPVFLLLSSTGRRGTMPTAWRVRRMLPPRPPGLVLVMVMLAPPLMKRPQVRLARVHRATIVTMVMHPPMICRHACPVSSSIRHRHPCPLPPQRQRRRLRLLPQPAPVMLRVRPTILRICCPLGHAARLTKLACSRARIPAACPCPCLLTCPTHIVAGRLVAV